AAVRAECERASTGALASTSIGIAMCPDDATDRHALLSHADTALYRAKAEGRGTYRFFEAKMGEAVRERRMLEHDLPHAVAGGGGGVGARLPAATERPYRRGHRARSTVALAARDARRHIAERVHSDCGGERLDPADRRMGSAHRLRRGRRMDASAHRRGERV